MGMCLSNSKAKRISGFSRISATTQSPNTRQPQDLTINPSETRLGAKPVHNSLSKHRHRVQLRQVHEGSTHLYPHTPFTHRPAPGICLILFPCSLAPPGVIDFKMGILLPPAADKCLCLKSVGHWSHSWTGCPLLLGH